MEGVVLHMVGILELFCPKQGQGFKLSSNIATFKSFVQKNMAN